MYLKNSYYLFMLKPSFNRSIKATLESLFVSISRCHLLKMAQNIEHYKLYKSKVAGITEEKIKNYKTKEVFQPQKCYN